ncbi:MFS transporter [Candidatus Woesearchaeota archaeon]|nr:MAG: MFS transporter [Candidatus Woesearchaeota archaeon]
MTVFGEGEIKLLWPFYLNEFFNGVGSLLGAYMIVYLLQLGFTIFEASLIFLAYSVSVLLFDIPTGAIADIYGRKISVILSFLSSGTLIFFAPSFTSFWWMVLVFALWGLFITLSTGSSDAWVVDYLKSKKQTIS